MRTASAAYGLGVAACRSSIIGWLSSRCRCRPRITSSRAVRKSIVREALAGRWMTACGRVKRSIQAPQGAWLRREPMRSYVASLIDSESFAERGLFNVPAVKAAFARFCGGEFDNSFLSGNGSTPRMAPHVHRRRSGRPARTALPRDRLHPRSADMPAMVAV